MDGEQLPKATMANFIKKTINNDFAQPYVQKLMDLSKEFIARVSNKSLQICTEKGKKNITVEHLQLALKNYGISGHLQVLRQLGNQIKIDTANRKQAIKQQEQNIRKQLQQQRQREESEFKRAVMEGPLVRETFSQIDKILNGNEQEYNYEQNETLQETV